MNRLQKKQYKHASEFYRLRDKRAKGQHNWATMQARGLRLIMGRWVLPDRFIKQVTLNAMYGKMAGLRLAALKEGVVYSDDDSVFLGGRVEHFADGSHYAGPLDKVSAFPLVMETKP